MDRWRLALDTERGPLPSQPGIQGVSRYAAPNAPLFSSERHCQPAHGTKSLLSLALIPKRGVAKCDTSHTFSDGRSYGFLARKNILPE